jgi:hypothetical protein
MDCASLQQEFPNLMNLLGAYFHQDWDIMLDWKGNEPSFEPIIDMWRAESRPYEVDKLRMELERFLVLPLTEDEVIHAVDRCFGGYYYPLPDMTYKEWLTAILQMLDTPTG